MISLGPVATAFPESTVAVPDLAELSELPPARRAHALSLGITSVRCADGDTEHDLAADAARGALECAGLAANDIDALLVVGGRAPRYLLASDATRLQQRLGANRAFVTGIGELGCVSISAGFTLAAALLRGDTRCRAVLVVAAATAPTRYRYRAPMTILGDGAAAVVLRSGHGGRYQLIDHEVRSDGRYADLFRIDYRDLPSDRWRETCADEATYSFRLAVESRERFTAMNDEILSRNGFRIDDMGSVVMQNLSTGAFTFWEEALGVGIDAACRRNLTEFGHLGSVDVLVNLDLAAETRAPGDHLLLLNSSPVAAWSTSLLRRLPDGDRGGMLL